MSQSELAKKTGVSRSTICNYESGRRVNVTAPVLLSLCSALNVTWQELVSDTELEHIAAISFEGIYSKTYLGDNTFINGVDTMTGNTVVEIAIIRYIQMLNHDGQLKAMEFLADLVEHPKYKKGADENG